MEFFRKYFSAITGPFAVKYSRTMLKTCRTGSPVIAVGPVAAEQQTIFAEDAEQFVEFRAIEIEICGYAPVHPAQHFGNLHVNLRALAEFPHIGIGCGRKLRQMINDDSQIGNQIRDAQCGCEQFRSLVGGVEH